MLQPGSKLLAAGYSLYSSATMLVITLGNGVHGFTLDSRIGEFVLTHPDLRIPAQGEWPTVLKDDLPSSAPCKWQPCNGRELAAGGQLMHVAGAIQQALFHPSWSASFELEWIAKAT